MHETFCGLSLLCEGVDIFIHFENVCTYDDIYLNELISAPARAMSAEGSRGLWVIDLGLDDLTMMTLGMQDHRCWVIHVASMLLNTRLGTPDSRSL
jgi:hypothetical protein